MWANVLLLGPGVWADRADRVVHQTPDGITETDTHAQGKIMAGSPVTVRSQITIPPSFSQSHFFIEGNEQRNRALTPGLMPILDSLERCGVCRQSCSRDLWSAQVVIYSHLFSHVLFAWLNMQPFFPSLLFVFLFVLLQGDRITIAGGPYQLKS